MGRARRARRDPSGAAWHGIHYLTARAADWYAALRGIGGTTLSRYLPRRARRVLCAARRSRGSPRPPPSPRRNRKFRTRSGCFPIDEEAIRLPEESAEDAAQARRCGTAGHPRQRSEVHAGAHQRSVQRARLAAEFPHSDAGDRRQGTQAEDHRLRVLPHPHRPGPAREFRAGRAARGLYKGAAARLPQRQARPPSAPRTICRAAACRRSRRP